MEEKFRELIINSLRELPSEIALGFSGGIDSVVIAKLLKDNNIKFSAYVVSTKKSQDLDAARIAAKEIGIKLKEIIVNEKEIEKAIPIQSKILVDLYKKKKREILKTNSLAVSYNLPLFFLFREAREKNIILAQGPDAMLGGYKRYLKKEYKGKMHEDTLEAINKDLIQNQETANYFSKKCFFPYMNKEIIEFCKNLPENMKINKERKFILRQLARKLGLSEKISSREKKACQYGSGIMREIEKLTRKKGIHIKDYL